MYFKIMDTINRDFLLSFLKEHNFSAGQVIYKELSNTDRIAPKHIARYQLIFKEYFTDIQSSTVDNFLRAHLKEQNVTEIFGELTDFILLSSQEFDTIIEANATKAWDTFKEIYPQSDGITDISVPGFSEDQQEALFYKAGFYSEWVSAGDYYLYRFQDGTWKCIKKCMAWIS